MTIDRSAAEVIRLGRLRAPRPKTKVVIGPMFCDGRSFDRSAIARGGGSMRDVAAQNRWLASCSAK